MGNKYKLEILNKENLLNLLGYQVGDKFDLGQILDANLLKELGLDYGLIYNFDSVATDKIEDIKIDLENIMEARFFNDDKEIRILRNGDEFKATIFVEKEDTSFIEKTVVLYKRDKNSTYAKNLKIKKYIDYDEDNQAYVRYTKPCKLNFGEGKQ